MADTTARLLALLSLLQRRRSWSGHELAEALEVSGRTLRRDVDRLRELGYPVEAQRGVDGGYQLAAGAVLPPLVLDDEEAIALGVGLQAAVQGGTVAGIAEASARALAKVVKVMPPPLRRRVDALTASTIPASWGGGPAIDPGVLAAVAEACRDGEQLEFDYTARDGAASSRLVEPHRLVLLGRRWYLVAWDRDRFDWRSFRVDRLTGARSTGAVCPSRQLPASDAAEFVRAAIGGLAPRLTIEARVLAPGAEVSGRLGPWAAIEELDAASCRLTMTVESLDWAVMALAATGADFEVLAPDELRDHLHRLGRRFERAGRRG